MFRSENESDRVSQLCDEGLSVIFSKIYCWAINELEIKVTYSIPKLTRETYTKVIFIVKSLVIYNQTGVNISVETICKTIKDVLTVMKSNIYSLLNI